MNLATTLLFAGLSALLTACPYTEDGLSSKFDRYDGLPSSTNSLRNVRVTYYDVDGTTEYGGVLVIQNDSGHALEHSIITLNDRYSANLEDILYYFGFIKGNVPLGRHTIDRDERLLFVLFDEDGSHLVFREKSGHALFDSTRIFRLTINATQGEGTWTFRAET